MHSCPACFEFEPKTVEDPPCRGATHVKSAEAQTSSRWYSVEFRRVDASSAVILVTLVQNDEVHRQKPSRVRVFGDGPRHFEPRSNDENDILAGTPSPNFHTNWRWYWARTRDKASHDPIPRPLGYCGHTPTEGRLSLDRFNVHTAPLHGRSSTILGSNS
ncbi:hypothetical protein TNCV_3528591 [Trichonephila clavipes]|nr:hypothetical protein TNCV_3528591 [Trichonephila clavipes]